MSNLFFLYLSFSRFYIGAFVMRNFENELLGWRILSVCPLFIKYDSGRFYQTFLDPLQYWFLRKCSLLIDVLHKVLHVFVLASEE